MNMIEAAIVAYAMVGAFVFGFVSGTVGDTDIPLRWRFALLFAWPILFFAAVWERRGDK